MSRQEYDSYQRKDYGPGYGGTGRAEKDQFSIDGKTWAYRDPYNQSMINSQNRGDDERTTINEHSYEMTNALYDYCPLYTSPSPRDRVLSRMPSSA